MEEDLETGFGSPIPPVPAVKPRFDTVNTPLSEMPQRAAAVGKDLTSQQIASLARQLVQNIRAPTVVLQEFGLTEADYHTKIKPNPLFAQALEALTQEWNDATNTGKRLRIQAQAILEDTMPSIGARIADRKEVLEGAVKAFQAVSKIAGMEDQKPQSLGSGEKFTITINLGGEPLVYEKTTGIPIIEGKAEDDKS